MILELEKKNRSRQEASEINKQLTFDRLKGGGVEQRRTRENLREKKKK